MDCDRGRDNHRHVVAACGELLPGQRKIVNIAGREIGVFNVKGDYYALRNICPHRGGPLCRGRLRPLVVAASVYQVDHCREGEILKCPWHLWEFDLKTGKALYDETLRVRTYPVRREGDEVVLYLERTP